MEYYSAMKRNEAQTQATTGMNLENIMLSERSQSEKRPHSIGLHSYKMSQIGKSIETREQIHGRLVMRGVERVKEVGTA